MKRLTTGPMKKVQFELAAEPGSNVFVAGTFNNWSETSNRLKHNPDSGHFKAALRLPAGAHEYKFVVDGVWCMDPNCRDWIPNGCGSLNSLLQV